MSRELRVLLLVIALVIGSLEALIYTVQTPPAPAVDTAAAAAAPPPRVGPAPPPAPRSAPGLACHSALDGHYPQIGYLQSVPVESPCD